MRIPPHIRAWVEIDLGRLEANVATVRTALPKHLQYIAVVKADAYGHGLEAVVERLMRADVDVFAVANLSEANTIREIGTGWPILVLSALLPGEETQAVQLGIMQTVSSEGEVHRLQRAACKFKKPVRVHLKIDTGMGRLGVLPAAASGVYQAICNSSHLELAGISTHFADSNADPDYTAIQRERFLKTLNVLNHSDANDQLVHADNSAGLDTFPPGGPFNGARVGLLQFGVSPHPGSLLATVRTLPVLTFHTRLSLIKTLPEGHSVSYGRTHQLSKETRIGVLSAGYGDGIPTAFSNSGHILLRGQKCPILGRVTMDQTMIDLSAVPEAEVGDTATLIGDQGAHAITAREFAFSSHQIPWEAFCAITGRVARFYRTDTAL
tara:strand:- start:853 stop:1995 length:1143 start_codon:yes stop_codon:yes gene_type:complete